MPGGGAWFLNAPPGTVYCVAEGDDAPPEAEGLAEDAPPEPAAPATNTTVPRTAVHAAIKKLHINLGHPHRADLLRVLQHGGASPLALEEARRLRCGQCEESAWPKPPREAKLPRDYSPLSKIAMDVKQKSLTQGRSENLNSKATTCSAETNARNSNVFSWTRNI